MSRANTGERLLLTAAFVLGLSAVFSLATSQREAGILGAVGLVAYYVFDAFFTLNPATWWRDRIEEQRRAR